MKEIIRGQDLQWVRALQVWCHRSLQGTLGLESKEPCWAARLVGASSRARRVLDLMPGQGTSWKQQMDVSLSHISLSLLPPSLPPCLSLKAIHISSCEDKKEKNKELAMQWGGQCKGPEVHT